MQDLDGEAFAGELHPLETAVPRRRSRMHLGAALRSGLVAGLAPAALMFVIYYAQHAELPLPWLQIASILAVYAPFVGVSLAVSTEIMVAAADAVARLGYGLYVIANPITGCGLAGTLAGIVPGAIGVRVFGAYHGPFVGTPLIAISLIAGAVLAAVPLARRARRARACSTRDDMRALVRATVAATLTLCAIAVVLTPAIVAESFAHAGTFAEHGIVVGAVAGSVAGGVIGFYVGLVVVFGRLSRGARYSRRIASTGSSRDAR